MSRRMLAAFVVVLGAACGCRSSTGITAAPSPPRFETEVKLPAELPAPVAAAIDGLRNDLRSKAETQPPETALRWRSPCNRRIYHVWSYYEPLLRLEWFVNSCGDSFFRITDVNGTHWLFGHRPW